MKYIQKINKFLNKNKLWTAVIGLILLFSLSIFVWVATDLRPPHWDMGRHLLTAIIYKDWLLHHKSLLILGYQYYPPLVYVYAAAWSIIFGTSVLSFVSSNLIWVTVIVLSCFGIGKEIKRPWAGIFAGAYFLTLPLISSVVKEFQLDVPLAAMAGLNLYLLFKTELLTNRKWSIWYGVSLGIGMLTKWTFVFMVPWPLMVIAFFGLRQHGFKQVIRNLTMAILVGYAIAIPWYSKNYDALRIDFAQNAFKAGIGEGDPPVLSTAGMLWYPNIILLYYLHIPWLIGLIGGVWTLSKLKLKKDPKMLAILALTVGTIAVFTLLRNKDARYILPAFVGVGLIAGVWFDVLIKKKKYFVAGLLASSILISALFTSFLGVPPLPLVNNYPPLVIWRQTGYITGPPVRQEWCQREAVKHALSIDKRLGYTGDDSMWFNNWGLAYYVASGGGELVQFDKSKVVIVKAKSLADGAEWQCNAADGSIVGVYRQ